MKLASISMNPDVRGWVDAQFVAYNAANGYSHTQIPFCYELTREGERMGIAEGFFSGGWCYLSSLVVAPDVRGRGHGRALLAFVEEQAKERQSWGIHLTTFSNQAPLFYEKNGFEKFAELRPFGPEARFYYRKMLKDNG